MPAMMRFKPFILALLLLPWMLSAHGAPVTGQLPNGLWVNAQYHKAADGMPTLLLIHPLQQTYKFSTIANLAENLVENGYGLLMPNLSLGVQNRTQGLECEAIHLTGMDDDVQEVGFWIDWLYNETKNPVIAMGHSTGALQLLATQRSDHVQSMILISLVSIGPKGAAAIDPAQLSATRAQPSNTEDNRLSRYRFSYCNDYVTTRKNYLSYTNWNDEKLADRLASIEVKTSLIMGDEDLELSTTWTTDLNQPLLHIHHVEGANHFFSGVEEFDLHDKVLEILQQN